MSIALGIDTGGTFTDAVLVDHDSGQVLAEAEALTTRHNLAIGIDGAISGVFESAAGRHIAPRQVSLVALSTTLATNTLAEGQRGTVALLLIGYDRELIDSFGFRSQLATDDIVYIAGGHDALGNQVAPLDEQAARQAILARRHSVEAFAISGYFGVRNPDHEQRVRAMVEQLTGLPVTCGHELTSRLDAVRRATTVALNAHLILPLRELMEAVEKTLHARHISAPLMVVKGDGSLVRVEWAIRRPIETILSGPAASVVGAWHLAGRRDMWVVDVGGTTTDIACLRDGLPILSADGANVAGWRTMIEAVDVHTSGLGGDSQLRVDAAGHIQIGPRRGIPLCLLASEYPQVCEALRAVSAIPRNRRPDDAGQFVVAGRQPEMTLSSDDREVIEQLAHGPQAVSVLTDDIEHGWLLGRRINELEARGLVRRSGFTPTDALHVLGVFTRWDREAACLGAELLASQYGLVAADLCREVVRAFSRRVTTELVSKIVTDDDAGGPDVEPHLGANVLLKRALDGGDGHDLACTLTLQRPLVAIGAPVAAFLPAVAGHLHAELVIPPFSGVANAVGAVAGGIVQRLHVLINPLEDGALRLHLPDGMRDFAVLEDAIRYAQDTTFPAVEDMARQAGADHIELRMERHDQRAPTARGQGEEVYLGTELIFTAAGRPSMAHR